MGGKAFGHDYGAEERPQEVERPEGVAVVYEEDERVTVRRVERHRTDATAKLVFEKVGDAAQSRHLAGDAQHKALPGRPDRQSWVAHHPRRRAGRQRWSRHKGQSLDSSVHEKHHEQPAMSSRHQTNVMSEFQPLFNLPESFERLPQRGLRASFCSGAQIAPTLSQAGPQGPLELFQGS